MTSSNVYIIYVDTNGNLQSEYHGTVTTEQIMQVMKRLREHGVKQENVKIGSAPMGMISVDNFDWNYIK